MVPEFLALVHVGDVDLDGGELHRGQGVTQCHGGVGEGAGVDAQCPPAVPRAAWMTSSRTPSWLDWTHSTVNPWASAAAAASCSTSARVDVPYFSGSRVPSRFRLGPLITRMVPRPAAVVVASVMDANLAPVCRPIRRAFYAAAPVK